VLRREPHHIGANHYYIHAVEASPTPERALPSAARLMGLAPAAGHLVHMPGHIFLRTGDFEQAAFTNERAVRADQDYIRQAKVSPGVYSMGYASHNIHFIVFARAMSGRFADARKAADELAAYVAPGLDIMPPMVDYFGVNSLLVLYRFNRWDDILKVSEPNAKLPVTTALWRFARCTALARKGQTADAQQERKAFDAAVAKVPSDYMLTFNPAGNVLKVAAAILDARLSANDAAAVPHWRRAVADQDALHYDEPPPWFYPVRESLGAALLRSGKPVDAEAVFREDLRLNPRNGRSLFGLMKALEAQKKTGDAALVQREFDTAWKFADVQLKIEDY
jgi:tetratricopeptide (TPR) repeat protein